MINQQVQQQLIELEKALRQLNLWQHQAPPANALQSTQPFAVDTLDFHQWLQFVMIPRLQAMMAAGQPLPTRMAVSPMAAQVYKGQLKSHRGLIRCLRDIDILISGTDPMQAS